jgi:hypothetical protein
VGLLIKQLPEDSQALVCDRAFQDATIANYDFRCQRVIINEGSRDFVTDIVARFYLKIMIPKVWF